MIYFIILALFFFTGMPSCLDDNCCMLTFFFMFFYFHSHSVLFCIEFVLCSRFSFHSIVHNIHVWYKKANGTSFYRFYFEMINPANVVKVFADRVSSLLSCNISNTSTDKNNITNRECEVAELLCGVLESIVNSQSHTCEVETTLDHDSAESELINGVEYENEVEKTFDSEWSGEEEGEDKAIYKEFSLEYMTRAVNSYDEVNPKTGKRKRRWETVKHHFWRIPHQTYIAQFRRYLEKNGTKKQKLDKIDDLVFDMFERAQEAAPPVHDIDLRHR